MSILESARMFGLHRDTVRKMLAYQVPPERCRQPPPGRTWSAAPRGAAVPWRSPAPVVVKGLITGAHQAVLLGHRGALFRLAKAEGHLLRRVPGTRRGTIPLCFLFRSFHKTPILTGPVFGEQTIQLPLRFSAHSPRSIEIPSMPGTGKTAEGGGPGSPGGADALFACAAHTAYSTQGGASVLHCYLCNIP